jgi:DNA mismatch endonuclease (patch repair protein)
MRGNKRKDTKPEVAVRSALHKLGYRFRKDYLVETEHGRVRVDIAFPRQRLAVQIDGCFWHRCPEHGNTPRANSEYWRRKLERNVARDRRNDEELSRAGWRVTRIWEHASVCVAVAQIGAIVRSSAIDTESTPEEHSAKVLRHRQITGLR